MKVNLITATMLYDFIKCPHRVTMDLFGNPAAKDPVSPFVELLWERGHLFEKETIERIQIPFINLRDVPDQERERLTLEAIAAGERLIYGGRIRADDLLGEPDLLRKRGAGFVAGDIKSGAGLEGSSEDADGKPKQHYAVQLSLYTDILERLGFSAGRLPFVWDIHGQEVLYHLDSPRGPKTHTSMWDDYLSSLENVRSVVSRENETVPSLGGECKLCHWRTTCTKQLEELNDLTLIPELGRSRRDNLLEHIMSVQELASVNISSLICGSKTVIPGISAEMLKRFQARARLQIQPDSKPYLIQEVQLPPPDIELFFDVENDPMRDICYLHGFVERKGGNVETEKYVAFFAEEPTNGAEKEAFAQAWQYIRKKKPTAIYFYSPYERTVWRKLADRHSSVATEVDVEGLFSSQIAMDLYHGVVRTKMEWPTRDLSIKTLAIYLGFKWRDPDPSRASSIEWYHRWIDSGDVKIKQRILDYNQDDCLAMRVLADTVRSMMAKV
jgi:uncharacterized protein